MFHSFARMINQGLSRLRQSGSLVLAFQRRVPPKVFVDRTSGSGSSGSVETKALGRDNMGIVFLAYLAAVSAAAAIWVAEVLTYAMTMPVKKTTSK